MSIKQAAGISAIATMAIALMPAPAHADAYRYWSYWTGGDQWTYSSRGPGFRSPADGGVEGWRFVVSPKDGSQAAAPRTASTFDQLCPGTAPAPTGQKRVAVVIDFGPAGIAPVGQTPPKTSVTCLTVPAAANGLQTLQKAAQLRFHSSGLICGIAGYPASECPGQSAPRETDEPKPTRNPTSQPPGNEVTPDVLPEPDATRPPSVSTSPSATSPSPTASTTVSDAPTPVALAAPTQAPPDRQPVPAWVAAIGAALIAALLGLAILIGRGRA